MTVLPAAFRWTARGFQPATPQAASHVVVADSWRVHGGTMWGLEQHLDRFMHGMTAQQVRPAEVDLNDIEHFKQHLTALLKDIARQHSGLDLFPRISLNTGKGGRGLVLLVRPAPPIRATTSLWLPDYTDPRIRPTVKGPDIDLMRRLVAEAATDDVVLHDGTNVIEATTGALLMWHTPQELVLCHASQQLASISAQRIAHHARSHHIDVIYRPVSIQQMLTGEYPVWFTNTLHGISPVTTISGGVHGVAQLAFHPETAAWQQAWWANYRR